MISMQYVNNEAPLQVITKKSFITMSKKFSSMKYYIKSVPWLDDVGGMGKLVERESSSWLVGMAPNVAKELLVFIIHIVHCIVSFIAFSRIFRGSVTV